jgi:hypothetical protein
VSGVARRRYQRQFGPGPYILDLRWLFNRSGHGFPFDVPAMVAIEQLDLVASVTLLAGDNGAGKATVIEALAQAMGFASEGGELTRLGELPSVPGPIFKGALAPVLSASKPREGYFLRARVFSTSPRSSTAVIASRPTFPYTVTFRCMVSPTESHSSRSPRAASAARASTSSTSPRRRCRSAAR